MVRLSFIIVLLSLNFQSLSQTANYVIKIAGFEVGTQTVNRTHQGDSITYKIQSDVVISMIYKYRVSFTQTTTFDQRKLLDSKVVIIKNDSPENSASTKWNGQHYEFTCDGRSGTINREILYSGGIIYFTEPSTSTTEIYGETPCYFKTIRKTGDHTYQSTDPQTGRENTLIYKDGILQKAIVHHPLVNFVTELIDYTP